VRVRSIVSVILLLAGAAVLLAAVPAWAQEAAAPEINVQMTPIHRGPFQLPANIAKQGYAHQGDRLIDFLHVFMIALFVGWGAFFTYCLVRFRRTPGQPADSHLIKAKPSKYLEIAVAVVEAVLLIGISMPAWASFKQDLPSSDEEPLRVRVIGEQFAWNFHYPGKDGVFGKTSPERIDLATNPMGLDRDDPHSEDDIVAGEFHIPVDRPVIAAITSKDVIHSFFVPVLRVKQDAIPGMRIPIWFEAGATGNYEIACAQLCGNNHYSMRAVMVVENPTDFDKWAEEKSAPPEFFEDF